MSTTTQTYTPVQGARWMAKKGLRITALDGKAPRMQGWTESATTDLNLITEWDDYFKHPNFGCLAKKGEFLMVDEDIAGVLDRFTAETGIVLNTLRVKSSEGRFHWYLKATPDSDARLKNILQDQFKDGAASVRWNNEQCVCPFSWHPEKGTQYEPVDLYAPIQAIPSELVTWLLAQQVQVPKPAEKPVEQPRQKIIQGGRNVYIFRRASTLREQGLTHEEISTILYRENEELLEPGLDKKELDLAIKQGTSYKQGDPTPSVTIGGKIPGEAVVQSKQQESSLEVIDADTAAELAKPENKTVQTLQYPIHVWKGTLYEEFANICGEKNKVAREYFCESIKTVVGAICGHRMQTKESRGQQPARFYTILIGPGGGGKSSAQKWAVDMFIGSGLLPELNQTMATVNIGVGKGCFSSDAGLVSKGASKFSRLIQVYDEVTALVEKFSIPGSGDMYLDQINGMFESGYIPQSVTKTSKDSAPTHPVDMSILGCTTETKWANSFRKTNTEKSGFFQRLNIITNDSEDRVADFNPPDLTEFREKLLRKIMPLEYQQVEVMIDAEALELFNSWYQAKQKAWKDMPTDVTGRLQVMVKRNLAHIAWLSNGDEGTLDPDNPDTPITAICDVDIMQRGIDLSEYQERARLIHQPILAENDWALLEGLIIKHFHKTSYKPIERNKLNRKIHANRFGLKMYDQVLANLTQEGIIKLQASGEAKPGRKSQVIVWLGDEE